MKLICLIGTTGVALSVFASAFIESYVGYCVVYGACFGFFVGIGYMMPLKNTYTYFPNRKGMCAGICMMGYGVGSLAYNEIFLKLVNPDNLAPDSEHFFPKEVADNFPKALLFLSLIYFIIGVIAFLLFYPKPISLSTSILTEDSNIS
jgi:MFS family permease